MSGPVGMALGEFRRQAEGAGEPNWLSLPFFRDGSAERVAAALDDRIAAGARIVPPPEAVFNALALTPLARVRAVILGQDPYPTPGDAHGLAFSYAGSRRLPVSLRVILAEMARSCGVPMPARGNLTGWARQGVLLLNTALTAEAGQAGAHLRLGWSDLTDQAVAAVSAGRPAVAFLLWGGPARQRAGLIDTTRHLVLETGHPSPLNRKQDFPGCDCFATANEWLRAKGEPAIAWDAL